MVENMVSLFVRYQYEKFDKSTSSNEKSINGEPMRDVRVLRHVCEVIQVVIRLEKL